jgi:mannose/fructose/N-acetylgalactosamine-specific phosphotransferase system component IIC
MKVKHAVLFIVLGFGCTVYGVLQKILHTPYADMVLKVGIGITAVCILLLLYKLFKDALA